MKRGYRKSFFLRSKCPTNPLLLEIELIVVGRYSLLHGEVSGQHSGIPLGAARHPGGAEGDRPVGLPLRGGLQEFQVASLHRRAQAGEWLSGDN